MVHEISACGQAIDIKSSMLPDTNVVTTNEFLMNQFDEDEECEPASQNTSLLIRFCRKKYKCVLLYALVLLAIVEATLLIIKKLDDATLSNAANFLLNAIGNNTTANTTETFG